MFTKNEKVIIVNVNEYEVLKMVYFNPSASQRELSAFTGLSLGKINKSIKKLKDNKFLNDKNQITEKTYLTISNNKPESAIILSAGYGLKTIPLCRETPKALLEINGEILIERLINQLHDAGVFKIYVVVGYMKEKFEYLIDKYNIEIVVNNDYKLKNNLRSLDIVSNQINNTYILPSDIYCYENPFNNVELYSWYMISKKPSDRSNLKYNRNKELIRISECQTGNKEIGIAYVGKNEAELLKKNIGLLRKSDAYNSVFWEEAIWTNDKSFLKAKLVDEDFCTEINTYDDLVRADINSVSLNNEYIDIICNSLNVAKENIHNITLLKSGMTNHSFIFNCNDKKYIFRIPGEGTDKLINRKNEYNVYLQIKDKGISDDIVYIDPEKGYKITEFLENSHNCDPYNDAEVSGCMNILKAFHEKQLSVENTFNIFDQIEIYESLRNKDSAYSDYEKVKINVFKLKEYIDNQDKKLCLTHIDAVPDNFVISNEGIRLIDWEYAAMQDPHVDIAMFAIYSLYDKERVDLLIDLYFDNKCPPNVRLKIYCYIAVGGLLWSNWCEYKATLGIEFGEYSLRQYRYAKDFYRYFWEAFNSEQS